jgi:hypothetical protein
MGPTIELANSQPADESLSGFVMEKAYSAIGEATVSIGNYDYFCDLYFLCFAEKYPEYVKEIKKPPPFNANKERTEWIIRSIDWMTKNKSKNVTNFHPFQDISHIEKSCEMLWDHRKNIQHSHLISIIIQKPVKFLFRKAGKAQINPKKNFEIRTYEYDYDLINEISGYARDLSIFIRAIGKEFELGEFGEIVE